jgi:hypothetical protein
VVTETDTAISSGLTRSSVVYPRIEIQNGRERRSRQIAWIERSTVSMVATALTRSTSTPSVVRRTALAANSSMYTVMMRYAISGTRFRAGRS